MLVEQACRKCLGGVHSFWNIFKYFTHLWYEGTFERQFTCTPFRPVRSLKIRSSW